MATVCGRIELRFHPASWAPKWAPLSTFIVRLCTIGLLTIRIWALSMLLISRSAKFVSGLALRPVELDVAGGTGYLHLISSLLPSEL